MKNLRRRFMGDEWLFVEDDDEKVAKSSRIESDDLYIIDEKFKKMSIEKQGFNKVDRNFSQPQLLRAPASLANLKSKTSKYRSPWYINPKYWQQLSMIPEVNRKDTEERAKNLYYFLHKSEPNLNPLRSGRHGNSAKFENQYAETQKKLAGLQTVQNYKKYLEGKKLRLPACLQSLPDVITPY